MMIDIHDDCDDDYDNYDNSVAVSYINVLVLRKC